MRAADGVELVVTTSGHGPGVLLVHGSAVTGASWGLVARRLAAAGRSVHVLDRRGHGASGDRPGADQLGLEVEDVRLVTAAVAGRVGPVQLVGHSYGGLLAMRAAADATPALAALTVYEPSLVVSAGSGWTAARLARSRALLAAGDPAGATELFLHEVVAASGAEVAALHTAADAWAATVALAAVTLREGEALVAAGEVDLSRVAVPTQVLVGAESSSRFRAAARQAADRVPGAVLRALAGQGHLAMSTAPGLLARLIAAWPPADRASC